MALSFDTFRVAEVKNPNKNCVKVVFYEAVPNTSKKTSLIIFEQQIKYVVTEEDWDRKRVKVFIRDDQDPIMIDFHPDEYNLFETFFLALYNKDI